MLIYKITNTVNGKCYIGQTTRSLEIRFQEHLSDKSHCKKLVNAIAKYGKENFTIDLIQEISNIQELNQKEKNEILKNNSVDNGYNILSGGNNRKLTLETKIKISKSLKGKKKPIGFIETLKKFSEKPVYQYDKMGNYINSFASIEEARKKINTLKANISKVCNGFRKSAGGFQWKWFQVDKIKEIASNQPRGRSGPGKKAVALLDSKKNILEKYNSISEAAKKHNVSFGAISKVCLFKRNTIKGMVFRFLE